MKKWLKRLTLKRLTLGVGLIVHDLRNRMVHNSLIFEKKINLSVFFIKKKHSDLKIYLFLFFQVQQWNLDTLCLAVTLKLHKPF